MTELPLYERPGRELGSTWTQTLRACENCEHEHQGLVDWSDGTKLCVVCSGIRRKNLRTAERARAGR